MTRAIIFSGTKRNADQLANELSAQGHSAAALHGDMNQNARNRTIMKMRNGKIRLLVATDVAARGLDVNGITHVINYDLPKNAEDYVHRIGRTGRAGATGIAISFASGKEVDSLRSIERYIGQSIPQQIIVGLEPQRTLRRTSASGPSAPSTGKRWQGATAGKRFGQNTSSARPSFGAKPARKSYDAKPAFGDRDRKSFDAKPAFGDRKWSAKKEGGKAGDFNSRPARPSRWA